MGAAALLMLASSSSPALVIDNKKSCCSSGRLTRRRTALQLGLAAVVPLSAEATTSTPYSQSRTLQLGLDANGRIRACPSTNPRCVCTNPTSSSVASPLVIPESVTSAAEMLRQAIIKTQKNVSFFPSLKEDYIQVEVDGFFWFGGRGRDVMEFLVKMDAGVVAYRCMAKEVTFVYPFTTAVGDSRGQEQKIAAIAQELGWYAPDIQSSIDPR